VRLIIYVKIPQGLTLMTLKIISDIIRIDLDIYIFINDADNSNEIINSFDNRYMQT
jgi:hypothetical protein